MKLNLKKQNKKTIDSRGQEMYNLVVSLFLLN